MKKVFRFIPVLLVFTLTLLVSCNSNVETTSVPEDEKAVQSTKSILDEPLVEQALKQLPETNTLGLFAVIEDSTNVTIFINDKKTGNVDIVFTTMFGEESLLLTRRYPSNITLELFFTFKNAKFSVEGSKICSLSDTTILDERDIYRITSDGYRLKVAEKNKRPIIRA